MRLDPPAHQPADHQPRSISGIRGQSLWLQVKALLGSLEHRLRCCDFSLAATETKAGRNPGLFCRIKAATLNLSTCIFHIRHLEKRRWAAYVAFL